MYLPEIERRQAYNEDSVERLLRNLVYVGLTRAMENLNVFTLAAGAVRSGDGPTGSPLGTAPADPIMRDVLKAFRRPPG